MAQPVAFGHPKDVTGKAGTFKATLVPKELLGTFLQHPVPCSTSGTSLVTFTVGASVSAPVLIWDGNDFISVKENKSYTWSTSANDILATTGALASAQVPGAVGVRYYYMGLDSTGALGLYPSTVQPQYIEGPFPGTILGHPGVARTRVWRYVGFNIMNATTPAFDLFVKTDYTYNVSTHALTPGVTTWTSNDGSAFLPKHKVTCDGFLDIATPSLAASIYAANLANATDTVTASQAVGIVKYGVGVSLASNMAFPFYNLAVSTTGGVIAQTTGAATIINVTAIHDVV